MSPQTDRRVLLALSALAALSGCTYIEKNYYIIADTGLNADRSDTAAEDDTGSAPEPEPEPIERQWVGEYIVDDGGGYPLHCALRLGLQVEAEDDTWGQLRTIESESSGGVVIYGITNDLRLEIEGAIDPEGAAAGGGINRSAPEAKPVGVPQPWTGAVTLGEGGVPRLEASGEVFVDVAFVGEVPYPFTLWAELQPLD